ncbi:hypothetical protein H6P81_000521 [Aristolochia fimbriata]|uniref:SCP domain-containing protein n=1 Tax=Aristolochia fimbriata TaxID=158543 RepID=A0AAV7F4U8_ARIFI|nr:hypothetical protein H6P81_000521 [Aristolochia fimbriata]
MVVLERRLHHRRAASFLLLLLFFFFALLFNQGNAAVQGDRVSAASQFLGPHNAVRSALGMRPLVWDTRVARYAQWYANQRRRDCALRHSNGPYGENIFWGSGTGWSPAQAVTAWAGERKWYRYWTNDCASGRECGHYTQMIWRTTRRLGCAKVTCSGAKGVVLLFPGPGVDGVGGGPGGAAAPEHVLPELEVILREGVFQLAVPPTLVRPPPRVLLQVEVPHERELPVRRADQVVRVQELQGFGDAAQAEVLRDFVYRLVVGVRPGISRSRHRRRAANDGDESYNAEKRT